MLAQTIAVALETERAFELGCGGKKNTTWCWRPGKTKGDLYGGFETFQAERNNETEKQQFVKTESFLIIIIM